MDLLTRMDGRGLQVEELGGWRWWRERKGGGDGREQESAATRAWWTVNEPGVTCLHSSSCCFSSCSGVKNKSSHRTFLWFVLLLSAVVALPLRDSTAAALHGINLSQHSKSRVCGRSLFLAANGHRVIRIQKGEKQAPSLEG